MALLGHCLRFPQNFEIFRITDSKEVYLCILRIYPHKLYAMLEHGNYTEILYDVYEC